MIMISDIDVVDDDDDDDDDVGRHSIVGRYLI